MKSSIMAKGEFDIAALRKSRNAAKAKVDLVGELRTISPEIEKLKVGETVMISGVAKGEIRKTVMGITAKLSHLTSKGGDWAGKAYDVASDGDAGRVYVQRKPNVPADQVPERKKGGGGGRKPKAQTAPTPAPTGENQQEQQETSNQSARVEEHA